MQLQSSTTITAGVPVVALDGIVDLSTLTRLRDTLLRALVEHPGARVVVDLDAVEVLDDTGLGILVGIAGRAREDGGELAVVASAPRLRRRFAATGLYRAIAVHPSIAAAVAPPAAAFVFHIALPADLEAAAPTGEYTISSRGRTLAEEGFIHCSFAHQVDATLGRFYADVDEVVVLRLDAGALGDALVVEDLPGTGEPFPHLYGPLPLSAVVGTERRTVR